MSELLECIPNFSEGRRADVIQQIADAARGVQGVRILGLSSDRDHNRSVLTLAGPSDELQEAVFQAVRVAAETIDLRVHTGEHPRVGATDVIPFVPMGATSMRSAVDAARSLGGRIATELDIPVYLYEEAASAPERRNLEDVRRKGFEELRDTIGHDPSRAPDFGPATIHPSAGATVVGARGPLIAYNIYLNTSNIAVAKAIARRVRQSSGGLRYVKALGLDIPERGQVQVSMNLTNYRKTPIHTVFNLVKSEAEAYGVSISDSEIVGLVPLDALLGGARHYLRLHDFEPDQILESALFDSDAQAKAGQS